MFQFTYKLKITERVKAKCERHPRYNPERDGRGGCSTSFSLFDLHQAKFQLFCGAALYVALGKTVGPVQIS